jgi:uncharacterized protein YdcH (DUF465 family)
MFHEYRDIIVKIKAEDKYFEVVQLEKNHADQFEIEKKKKEKLKLKDDIHTAILKYKKDNNL